MEINDTGRRATPYRAVWRWHFYAGLFVAPVLLVLASTGALYLFDWEVDGLMHRDALRVEARGAMQSLAAQEASARSAHPEAQITSMTAPRAPDEASRWMITLPEGGRRELFVDPYSTRVQAELKPDLYLMNIARKLHGTLLGGNVGSHLVELTACWTLVMLLTGLYLWWPKSWRGSAFVPRTGATGRAFWRDWHSIPAMFNAMLVILLVLTGMPWSAFWGTQLAKLGEQLPLIAPSPNFTGPPPGITGLPWSLQHHATPQGTHVMVAGIAPVEAALSRIEVARHGPGLKVNYPSKPGDVFIASYVPAKAEHQRTLYLDAGDGRVLGSIAWSDYSPAAKAIEWGVMTHMGRQYGLANQLAGLAACLVLAGTTVAGVILWWKRRPRGTLAAPDRRAGDRLPRSIVVTLVLLGLLFPLLGASLVVVALIDRYAAARFSGVGRPTA